MTMSNTGSSQRVSALLGKQVSPDGLHPSTSSYTLRPLVEEGSHDGVAAVLLRTMACCATLWVGDN